MPCTNCWAGFDKTIHICEIIYLREHLQVRALCRTKPLGALPMEVEVTINLATQGISGHKSLVSTQISQDLSF